MLFDWTFHTRMLLNSVINSLENLKNSQGLFCASAKWRNKTRTEIFSIWTEAFRMPVAIVLWNLFTNESEILSAFQKVITIEKKKKRNCYFFPVSFTTFKPRCVIEVQTDLYKLYCITEIHYSTRLGGICHAQQFNNLTFFHLCSSGNVT